MVSTQENSLFLAESKTLRGREGINLLVHACRSNSLSFFFPSFPIFSFSYLFLFLNPCFLFLGFKVSNTVVLVVVVPVHSKGLFIVLVVTRFYYFSSYPPLSSLGVPADHHWSNCVPLPITRQKKAILFVYLLWHPFLLRYGCLLSLYPSWHAPSGSSSAMSV